MAANEHKNLTDINRHNPKGFETATNNTVCSKNIGTSATGTDGSLVWQSKSLMGVTTYKMQSYVPAGTTNYLYGSDVLDNNSPFLLNRDSGSNIISSITITPSRFFDIGGGYVIPENTTVESIRGFVSSSGGNVLGVAICKVTPVENNTAAVAVASIKEITKLGLSSQDKLISVSETTFDTSSLSAGDIIFPMIKELEGTGSTIKINLTIRTTTF